MKNANEHLILSENHGAVHDNQKRADQQKQVDDAQLREMIFAAAENAGIQANAELIAAAQSRFVYSDNKLRARSIYSTLDEFLEKHHHNAPSRDDALKAVDNRMMKKRALYDELIVLAKVGDMKDYRACRTAYAQL